MQYSKRREANYTLRNRILLKIGDVDCDEEFNKKISPLFHIDNIKAPLLIGVLYPDEGHGFVRPDNRIETDFNGRVELFLEKRLGGRSEVFERPEGTTSVFPLVDAESKQLS